MTSDILNIKEILNDDKIIGLVLPDVGYGKTLVKVLSALSRDYDKILYISLDKPYSELINKFKQNKINIDKFYFIDCITRTVKDMQSTENCCFVSSPRELDEIHAAVSDALKKHGIDIVLIDSPSSLLAYHEDMDILQFIHRLITVFIVAKCKAVFPFQKEGMELLRRGIEMFTDKTVDLYVLT